jgi:hypothetical protein
MAKLVDLLYTWYWVANVQKQGVCHIVALPFTLNRQKKKNDENSNI